MARNISKAKGRRKSGTFMRVHHYLLNHKNFYGLSKDAKLIYYFLKSQYNGKNNGDLSATLSMIKPKGYGSSSATLSKALKELLDKGFIVKTRQGGKNQCNLYAVTDEAIDDCNGKHDFGVTITAPSYWKQGNEN